MPGTSSPGATSLPTPLTPLVGREREVAAVVDLLRRDGIRLVTLTGPGGVGKTRLALAVAERLAGDFADGVWFVPLAPIADPALVLPTVAQALGVREAGDAPLAERLAAVLRDERLLLVLDNVEQVVEAAPLVAGLLGACPGLKALVTSRVRLRVSAEREHVVPPLDLAEQRGRGSLADVAESGAVRLFVERAQAVREGFVLIPENAPDVAAICRRLDGLPLAIELAAARVKVLPPSALLARLERRLPLLVGGNRDAPARQRTMRDAIAWSHDLLTADERALFRRLAVFIGGFDLEAAAAVAGGEAVDALDAVASFADNSLLREEDGPGGEPRYLMLETVREFGLERLAASDEEEVVRAAHAAHYAAFADAIGTLCIFRPGLAAAFARLEADLDNLRAALAWAAERSEAATLIRLAVGMGWFWWLHGELKEGRAWTDRAAAAADAAPAPLRAAALNAAGWLARQQGDHERADELGARSLALFRELGDALGESEALLLLGFAAEDRGEFARAVALREEALRILSPLDEPIRTGYALYQLSLLVDPSADLAAAEDRLAAALVLFRRGGSEHGAAHALSGLGELALKRGEYARAAELWRERLGLTWDEWSLRWSLEFLASVAVSCGEAERAARLLGAAEAVRERLGADLPPALQLANEGFVAATRAALGDAAFAAAQAEGWRLSPEAARAEAARVARAERAAGRVEAAADAATHGLTRRELDVLRLLAEGRSDKEIGAALFISGRTVMRHVTGILAKLGVENRTAATNYAVRRGLV